MELWGLNCANAKCIHDSLRALRIDFWVRPAQEARPTHLSEAQWATMRRTLWRRERNPIHLRATELLPAYDQLAACGVQEPAIGVHIVEHAPRLPEGHDARRVALTEVPMPRIALYFRWRPDANELLTPDKVFQCVFEPGGSAADRRGALEVRLTPAQFQHVFRHAEPGWLNTPTPQLTRSTLIRCQHCHERIPVRAITTATLRQCDKGD